MKVSSKIAAALISALASCRSADISGQFETDPPFCPPVGVGIRMTVGGGGTSEIPPSLGLFGQCVKTDYWDGTGNHLGSTSGRIGVDTLSGPIPTGSVFQATSFFNWADDKAAPAGSSASRRDETFIVIVERLAFELAPGSVNQYGLMRIRAATPGEANGRAMSVLSDGIGSTMPTWLIDVKLSELGVLSSGDLMLEVGSRGTRVDQFVLDLNGVTGYSSLASGSATWYQTGEWVVVSTVLRASDLDIGLTSGLHVNAMSSLLQTDSYSLPWLENREMICLIP